MRRRAPAVALGALAAVLLVAALLPLDAVGNDLANRFAPPSPAHPLGTDHLGRDVFARLAAGTRLSVGFTVVAVAVCASSTCWWPCRRSCSPWCSRPCSPPAP
ncbi:hypothetical protein [Pseudonocardia hydrocarbonoxydans]|uniref:Oligopeptide transport permease C-like N-terminal domain-containing protein n=1 Tax=Pseudonocardia hydrocarbonoxydans TaxID=76726 RepID=A0A4Y3WPW9_9PSEU|nr:hypothetical protein [Pseudonocardia hydrocarbonoxydans]GEC20558.1 hypothetical protein PHY01_28410 [Pseudonocardia hydrocarbonoxydans]